MPTTTLFPDVPQMVIPAFIALILLELAANKWFGTRGNYETRDTATSLLMGVGSVVSGILFGFIGFLALMWVYKFRLFTVPFEWWAGVLCFVIDDLRYYWYHRIAHRARWVWAEHIVHHSSQHYNLSTALRQSWTQAFTGMFVLQIPLVLLGFHPAFILFIYGFNLVYQFWIHTEAIDKMPRWFEAVMNTPSHHRVHHATNPRYLDSNFAGTLIIWDKMFGSFVPELAEDKPRYGIVKNIGTFNPIKVSFHEWVSMLRDMFQPELTARQRLNYFIKPPGWRHDTAAMGSDALKQDYVQRNPAEAGKPGLPGRLNAAE